MLNPEQILDKDLYLTGCIGTFNPAHFPDDLCKIKISHHKDTVTVHMLHL